MGVWRALPCELRSVCKSNALQPAIGYAAHCGQQMRLFAVGFKQRVLGEIVHFGPDPSRFEEWFCWSAQTVAITCDTPFGRPRCPGARELERPSPSRNFRSNRQTVVDLTPNSHTESLAAAAFEHLPCETEARKLHNTTAQRDRSALSI